MKTSELTGATLNRVVAKCEGYTYINTITAWKNKHGACGGPQVMVSNKKGASYDFNPVENWSQGGPIIERERIRLVLHGDGWQAWCDINYKLTGPTPLIAAMRCYVASKLGDEVEIPEELKC